MIAMIATKLPINHAIGVFRLSTFASTYNFIRVSDALILLLTSSLTIKRILSRSASVNSAKVGNHAIVEKSIERTRIVFMGCSSASLIYPPATGGGWQKQQTLFVAVPPQTGHAYSIGFRVKKARHVYLFCDTDLTSLGFDWGGECLLFGNLAYCGLMVAFEFLVDDVHCTCDSDLSTHKFA